MPKLIGTYGQIVERRDDSRAALGEIVMGTYIPRVLWTFHRKLWFRYAMILEAGEYRSICLSLDRGLAEQVSYRQNLWAVRLRGVFVILHVRIVHVGRNTRYVLRPILPDFYQRLPGGRWIPTEKLPNEYRENHVTPVAA